MAEFFPTVPICCFCQGYYEDHDIDFVRDQGRCPHCDRPVKLHNEPMSELFICYLNVTGENEWYRSYEREFDDRLNFLRGMITGFTCYAWWKDGKQYVGSTGTTLRQALEAVNGEIERLRRVVMPKGEFDDKG